METKRVINSKFKFCDMYENVVIWTQKTFTNIWSLISGMSMSLLGYFLPIKDVVHFVIACFIIDMLIGYWTAKKTRGEKFSMSVVWNTTMPRLTLSLIIIILAFAWDTTFNQLTIASYKVVGWFICGVLIANIIQNSYKITKWNIFIDIGNYIKKQNGKK